MEVIDAQLATAGRPCELGNDPAKHLERFEEWYEHTDLLADSIGVKDADQKLRLAMLWGGRELRLSAKEAGVLLTGDNKHSLVQALEKLREHFGGYVNLSMAFYKMMTHKQSSKTVTQFHRELKELANQCQFEAKPYTKARAIRDAFLFGTSDDKLRQEALARDYEYDKLIKSALGYEQSRISSNTIKSNSASGEDVHRTYTQEEVDSLVARITGAGKFSVRNKNSGGKAAEKPSENNKCQFCPPHFRAHAIGKCPTYGKTCSACKGKNHFAGAPVCPAGGTVRRLQGQEESGYEFKEDMGRIEVLEVSRLQAQDDNHVKIQINGLYRTFLVDSGCRRTLIPYRMYTADREVLGPLRPAAIRLRPYGTDAFLEVKGQIDVAIRCNGGAELRTTVCVVAGFTTEALLGDSDAKSLGILCIHKDGNAARHGNGEEGVALVASDLRAHGVPVQLEKSADDQISEEEKARVQAIVDRHDACFQGVGLLKDQTVSFHIDPTVAPVCAPYRPVPFAYRERLSAHLQDLRDQGKIEDVDPKELCEWESNVVITEKKDGRQIRMNVDMRAANKAIKRTKTHVETIQEIRHRLKGATRFSDMDMSHGFHQVALAEESRYIATFRTHEGLHRFKVLFFGPTSAPDIFHAKIKQALVGLEGCVSIHDNILVWGKDAHEHERNLEVCLQRLHERGITLRREKCTFGASAVSWFGWIFSSSGMSADPAKITNVRDAGRPEDTEETKSYLQACQFNARFMFSDQAYAQATYPLRQLTRKNAKFQWTAECEEAYRAIMKAMTSETALRPFDPELATVHVADAGPEGIAASVYQIRGDGTWVPVDHASRSLTECEQRYSQTERESLAQSWGMTAHRYYLMGIKFDSYTDHMPLVSIYNNGRYGNARVERHRLQVQGMDYNMKYMVGKDNPCDYASRHPRSLSTFTDKERSRMYIDDGNDLVISAIITSDLPDAVTPKMVSIATKHSQEMQKLVSAIAKCEVPNDPELKPYRAVFQELACKDDIVLRGDRVVIPPETDIGNLRQMVVDIAHEGHQGEVKCKRLLRSRVWFPGLDDLVKSKVTGCIGCQATTYTPRRDPLKPTPLPDRAWQHVDMDFWGPLPSGEYALVIIDEYSRYPEVEIVSGTSAAAVLPHLDRVFATHGFPETAKTDGGPPFNGHEFEMYMKWTGVKHRKVSPDDPEANGLAENFMKAVGKVYHIAKIEGKSYRQELYKFLRQYRSTPHSTTDRAPAELLFNRKVNLRLPTVQKPTRDPELREHVAKAKERQKAYKDAKSNVKPHNISVGDRVLLLQRKTKANPQYDPMPYKVVKVIGTQIKAVRGDKTRVRDAKKFKKVALQPRPNYGTPRDYGEMEEIDMFPPPAENGQPHLEEPDGNQHQPENGPPRRQHQFRYPNGLLDPNIDILLPRDARNRRAPQRYEAGS